MTRPRQTVTHARLDQLVRHPENIRTSLGDLTDMARSIHEHGILQPLTVTEHPDGGYLLLAGHRRLAAAHKAGLLSVPVIVRHALDDPTEHLVVMLVENTHRRDLHPVERARAYGRLVADGLTQTEIARRTGTHPSTVNYYLTLLDLDQESLQAVEDGRLESGAAIAAVRDARQQERIANQEPVRGRPKAKTWKGGYFSRGHRLAPVVRKMCSHADRGVVGEVGCGPCWEQAIREEDQQSAQQAADQAAQQAVDLDEVAMQRRADGDRTVTLTRPERLELVRRLNGQGLDDSQIADQTGYVKKTIGRDRIGLGLPSRYVAADVVNRPTFPRKKVS